MVGHTLSANMWTSKCSMKSFYEMQINFEMGGGIYVIQNVKTQKDICDYLILYCGHKGRDSLRSEIKFAVEFRSNTLESKYIGNLLMKTGCYRWEY